MQLSTRWIQYLKSLPKNRLGFHNVEVFYLDGDQQKIAKGVIWNDGTLQTRMTSTFSERQITSIRAVTAA